LKLEVGMRKSEEGSRKWEVGIWNAEVGMGKSECGRRNGEVGNGKLEVGMGNGECGSRKWESGSGTRRRPIRRDYDAARCGLRPIGAYAYAPVGSRKEGKGLLNSEA
jgi:hypothetical protein